MTGRCCNGPAGRRSGRRIGLRVGRCVAGLDEPLHLVEGVSKTLVDALILDVVGVQRDRHSAGAVVTGYIEAAVVVVRALGTPLQVHATGQTAARLSRERGAAAAWTEVFVPYLQALGRQWERTGGGVQDEHIAVAALQAALRSYAARQVGRARTVHVVAAALPGEAHTLPLDALAAALAEVGCATSVLYDVPGPALYAAVQRHPGVVVLLWARGRADVALLRGVRNLAPPVRDGAMPDAEAGSLRDDPVRRGASNQGTVAWSPSRRGSRLPS